MAHTGATASLPAGWPRSYFFFLYFLKVWKKIKRLMMHELCETQISVSISKALLEHSHDHICPMTVSVLQQQS